MGKKRLDKKDKKGWHCDKILVHLKKIGPQLHLGKPCNVKI